MPPDPLVAKRAREYALVLRTLCDERVHRPGGAFDATAEALRSMQHHFEAIAEDWENETQGRHQDH